MKLIKENRMESLSPLYVALKQYIRKQINEEELYESDPLISDVRRPSNDLSETRVYIKFKNDDALLSSFGIDDEDINFLGYINNSTYEFFDHYQMRDDWVEGYGPLTSLSSENEEMLKKILNYSMGKIVDLSDYKEREEIAKFMSDTFPDETDELISEYIYFANENYTDGARRFVDRELREYFERLRFKIFSEWDEVYTTVGNLFEMYSDVGKLKLDLYQLINEKIEKLTHREKPGGFWDDMYEYGGLGELPDDNYQREIEKILERLWEKIQESGSEEIFEKIRELTKKFAFNKWYVLPKNPVIKFKIDKVDPDTGQIILWLEHEDTRSTKRSFISYENFYNFLYHPELFDLKSLFH